MPVAMTALITNIQKYTIHDGPGIRTELFFSGCTLSCKWCSNPETIAAYRRLGVYPVKCVTKRSCALCFGACPSPELHIFHNSQGPISHIRQGSECRDCLKCAGVCPSKAIKVWGEEYTIERIMSIIEDDREFYDRSGGGVTISGGEPLLQHDFAAKLLSQCHESGIGTCVESALNVPWEFAEQVFEHADSIITDIKFMDSEAHRTYCGDGNEKILGNIIKTSGLGRDLTIRTPIIMGINDDLENIRQTASFIAALPTPALWQLLPYRRLGIEKYESLGMPYPFAEYDAPPREQWEENLSKLGELITTEYGIEPILGSL